MSRTHISLSDKLYDPDIETYDEACRAALDRFYSEFPQHGITRITVERADDGLFEFDIRGE